MMMDDNVPTHERRKLVRIYKNVLPQIPIVVAEVCRRPTPNMIKKKDGVEKRPQT